MKSFIFVVLFLMTSFSAQARLSIQEYNSIINFVKLNAEWSFYDDVLEVQELTVLNEATLSLRQVISAPMSYEIRAEVINLDDEEAPIYGEIFCFVQLENSAGIKRVDQLNSSCRCFASFICGEREGNIY
jgi:UDP-3-O-acyl-N-acetylglucosamine deacetylase